MMTKELERQTHADPLRRAGYEAERQMAHDLKRAFGDRPEVKILHNLRLERWGEVAQIDHLALHRHGMIVIESKSVTGQVSVNERGDWARHWNGGLRGMPSPVLQGQRQADLLHWLLDEHRTQLSGKMLLGKLQKGFVGRRDHSGRQTYPRRSAEGRSGAGTDDRIDPPPLQGQQRVLAQLSLNLKDMGYEVTAAELSGIAAFLNARHLPPGRAETAPPPTRSTVPAPSAVPPPGEG